MIFKIKIILKNIKNWYCWYVNCDLKMLIKLILDYIFVYFLFVIKDEYMLRLMFINNGINLFREKYVKNGFVNV